MENATRHMMSLDDSLTAKKACERSSFNIGFAVIRQYEDTPLKRLAKVRFGHTGETNHSLEFIITIFCSCLVFVTPNEVFFLNDLFDLPRLDVEFPLR